MMPEPQTERPAMPDKDAFLAALLAVARRRAGNRRDVELGALAPDDPGALGDGLEDAAPREFGNLHAIDNRGDEQPPLRGL